MSDSKTSMDAAYVTKQRYRLGVAYMMAMGVCGIVLVAIGSNLKQLASNCNTSATKLGTVFIARGVGAIFGAICSAKLYRWFRGNRVMILVLFILSALVLLLPMVSDIYTMHVVFCLLGICTAITDSKMQI
jgi:predicted MFS family arabinose efflux permease